MSALRTSAEIERAVSPVAMPEAFEAVGVTFDSRAVGPGDIFFALSGETADGHDFVPDALSRGAAAAVVSSGASTISMRPSDEGAATQ